MKTREITERDNFIWLALALMALLFLLSLFEQLGVGYLPKLTGWLMTLAILVAVWSFSEVHALLKTRGGVYLVLAGIILLRFIFDYFECLFTGLLLILFFYLASIYICGRQVLLSGNVDGNKIVGAICIYLLMAVSWAIIYMMLEYLFPGSIPAIAAGGGNPTQPALYFSFVTLTSLGYGDISPLSPLARYFAYLQAVTGQFYMAILVASLVGVRLASSGGKG